MRFAHTKKKSLAARLKCLSCHEVGPWPVPNSELLFKPWILQEFSRSL